MASAAEKTRVAVWLLLLLLGSTAGCAGLQAEQQWKAKIEAAGQALEQHRLAAAGQLYESALREAEALGRETPLEGVSLVGLARVRRFQARYEEAEAFLSRALPILEKAFGQDVPVARAVAEMGVVQDFLGRSAAAEGLYRRSLGIFQRKTVPLTDSQVAQVLEHLAHLYRDLGRYAEATRIAELWRPVWSDERVVEKIPLVVAEGLVQLGELYERQDRYADAVQLLGRAVALREKALGEGHPVTSATIIYLARLHRAQGKPEDAERVARRALSAAEKTEGPEHPSVAESLGVLALLEQDHGRHQEAERLQRRALGIRERAFGQDDSTVLENLESLARLLRTTDRATEAGTVEGRVRAIRARQAEVRAALGPVEAQDGSCRVRLTPANPSRTDFVLQVLGFGANEDLEMTGRSNGEVLRQKLRVNADGSFAGRIGVAVLGKYTGSMSQTLIGKSCRLTLQVRWGRRIAAER